MMHGECCFEAFISKNSIFIVTAINKTISWAVNNAISVLCISLTGLPPLSTNETDNDDCTF